MSFYLVDYENVNKDGLNGINRLSERDFCCIFYSDNADNLTFGLHKKINESKATITFEKVDAKTKNSLDFQLVTYLGFLIASNPREEYCIVSKDNGFGSVCIFWNRRNVRVSMVPDLSGKDYEQENREQRLAVEKALGNCAEIENVTAYIQKYKTKQGINNALVKDYGNKRGGEIYKAIKPLLKDKKGKTEEKV